MQIHAFVRSPVILFAAACFCAAACFSLPASAQTLNAPRLSAIFPLGGQAGTEVDLTVMGDSLEGDQQLLFSSPSITASSQIAKPSRFQPTTRPVANHFTVRVPADALPGTYSVRLIGALGISNPRSFVVGALPELVQQGKAPAASGAAPAAAPAPDATPATATQVRVNSVINATFSPQASDTYRFTATRGQRLILHCTARLIDSRAEPQLALYDAAGTEIRRLHDAVHVDPTLDFTVPTDGEYVVRAHDFVYGGGPDFGYRLSISTAPWIDYVDPPFVSTGVTGKHTLYGRNLPGSSTASVVTPDGSPLEKLEVTIAPPAKLTAPVDTYLQPGDAGVDTFSYRFSGTSGISNPVRLALVDGPVIPEADRHDTPETAQPLTLPAQVSGQFNPRNDRDWYAFQARKGEKFWIELISQRLGLPCDPRMTIQQVVKDAAGKVTVKEIADVDDPAKGDDGGGGGQARGRLVNDDPVYAFTAPEDGEYRLLVQDLYAGAQGAPWLQYLLSIHPARPGFRLLAYTARLGANDNAATPSSTVLHKGADSVIDVVVLRRDGFTGAIQISADGLPAGVTAYPGVIARGASAGSLVLRASVDAADWAGAVRIWGRTAVGSTAPVDDANPSDPSSPHPAESTAVTECTALPVEVLYNTPNGGQIAPMRLGAEYGLAVRDGLSLPFTIDTGEAKVWRVPRGGKLQVPVKIARNAKFVIDEKYTGEIRFPAVAQGQVRAEAVLIDPGVSEKDLVVNIDPAAAPGSYALVLRAEAPAKLSRSSEVARQATDDFKRIDAIAKEIAATAQKAAQERDRTDQVLQQATAALAQANQTQETAKQASDAATLKAQDAAKALAHLLPPADAPPAANPGGTTRPAAVIAKETEAANKARAARTEAARVSDEATAKTAAASSALKTATTAVATAQERLTRAQAARDAAVTSDAAAKEDAKAAEEARRLAEEQARKATESGRPRDLRVQIAGPPIRLEVVPAPFAVKIDSAPPSVEAGGKPVEVSAAIMPEFGFADEVKFELVAPSGASGVSLPEKHNLIAKGQTEGLLSLQAEKGAKAGIFTYTLRAHYKFNNRDLTFDRPIPLQVAAGLGAPTAK